MKVRFGYVAMSMILKDCSPSKTVTVANLSKIEGEAERFGKLTLLARTNIENTRRLLAHNRSHDIKVFRISSRLIPLATHPIAQNWDWVWAVRKELESLGGFIREDNCRLSAHPDHYTVLNSPKDEVLKTAVKDLEYHHKIFTGMGLGSDAKLVMHVGGAYSDKMNSIRMFIDNYNDLPAHLKKRIILENDDKIYTTKDVLGICEYLGIPMVLDVHHHHCNNNNDDIKNYLPSIFDTWKSQILPPKVHISSPKDITHFRSHADNIDLAIFLEFLQKAKATDRDFDVMIEAKNKDVALFKLLQTLKAIPQIRFIDEASLEI